MGQISITVFTLLVAYSVLISGAYARVASTAEGGALDVNEMWQKRQNIGWLKSLQLQQLQPLNVYSSRSEFQPSRVEFVGDLVQSNEKRFNDNKLSR